MVSSRQRADHIVVRETRTGPPSLVRRLGLASAIALVVSNMIGTGIFTTTGFLAGDLGSSRLVLSIWVLGAVCALLGAVCYAELGVNLPNSGGEFLYLSRAFGPVWGFMSGWASFFAGFSAPIAAASLALSGYLGYVFPRFRPDSSPVSFGRSEWTIQLGWPQLLTLLIVGAFTLLNMSGIQRAARVQNVLTGLKLAILAGFVVLGFSFGHGNLSNFSSTAVRNTATPLAAQFAISLFWLYVAYSGWNAATYVAEELLAPARTLPWALAAGTGIVTLLYLALNAVFLYAAPLETLKGTLAVGALAASRLFGQRIASLFAGLMAVSLLATVNSMVTVGPRVYYAMAKDGAFPRGAMRVHPKWRTPVNALLAQAICTIVMSMTPFPQLVVYIGFTLNFFAVMSVAGLLILRREPHWQKSRVVSFCYPLLPALFLAVGCWVTVYGVLLKPYVSTAAILTIALGAVFYRLRSEQGSSSVEASTLAGSETCQ